MYSLMNTVCASIKVCFLMQFNSFECNFPAIYRSDPSVQHQFLNNQHFYVC